MARTKGFGTDAAKARSEDLAFMADWYETTREAARRLGISRDSLYTWCLHNDPDVWQRLLANDRRRQVAS